MLAISFYRPQEYFSGVFNKFVTWFTAGSFCHCELVAQMPAEELMTTVKKIYTKASSGKYEKEDCNRTLGQIERFFFSTRFRKHVQTNAHVTLSFSAIWGEPMTCRVLHQTSPDSWFKIPEATDTNANIIKIPHESTETLAETMTFAIEELGKDYNQSGALFSWLPFTSNEHKRQHKTYYCSEFCATALQRIGHIGEVNAVHCTPNSLYHTLNNRIRKDTDVVHE
jgi:hypothetical protein|tara:strand:- start:408 stop:1082 length:675 start_codon:yes stop_codon:yes gene_type:complete